MGRNAAATMDRIAGAAVAAALVDIVAAVAVDLEVEVVVFEEVVAGVDGTVGRFRNKGDFPDARQPRTRHGEVSRIVLDTPGPRPALSLATVTKQSQKLQRTKSNNRC